MCCEPGASFPGAGLHHSPFCTSKNTGTTLSCPRLTTLHALVQTCNKYLLNEKTSLPQGERVWMTWGGLA